MRRQYQYTDKAQFLEVLKKCNDREALQETNKYINLLEGEISRQYLESLPKIPSNYIQHSEALAEAYDWRSICHFILGNTREAKKDFLTAIKHAPTKESKLELQNNLFENLASHAIPPSQIDTIYEVISEIEDSQRNYTIHNRLKGLMKTMSDDKAFTTSGLPIEEGKPYSPNNLEESKLYSVSSKDKSEEGNLYSATANPLSDVHFYSSQADNKAGVAVPEDKLFKSGGTPYSAEAPNEAYSGIAPDEKAKKSESAGTLYSAETLNEAYSGAAAVEKDKKSENLYSHSGQAPKALDILDEVFQGMETDMKLSKEGKYDAGSPSPQSPSSFSNLPSPSIEVLSPRETFWGHDEKRKDIRLKMLIEKMGYNGEGNQLRKYYKGEPILYWEEEMGIGLTTASLQHTKLKGHSLWEAYQRTLKKSKFPDILEKRFPFPQWLNRYINILPEKDLFKDFYLTNINNGFLILKKFSKEYKHRSEIKIEKGLLYVRGDHPNQPFDKTELNNDIPKDQQWLKLDTTVQKVRDPGFKQPGSPDQMIYVFDEKENTAYCHVHAPGSIHHSSFSDATGKYDGGSFHVEKGQIHFLQNQSGHIRPLGEDNFLLKGFARFLYDHNALNHLKHLIIFSKELEVKESEKHFQGSSQIKTFLEDFYSKHTSSTPSPKKYPDKLRIPDSPLPKRYQDKLIIPDSPLSPRSESGEEKKGKSKDVERLLYEIQSRIEHLKKEQGARFSAKQNRKRIEVEIVFLTVLYNEGSRRKTPEGLSNALKEAKKTLSGDFQSILTPPKRKSLFRRGNTKKLYELVEGITQLNRASFPSLRLFKRPAPIRTEIQIKLSKSKPNRVDPQTFCLYLSMNTLCYEYMNNGQLKQGTIDELKGEHGLQHSDVVRIRDIIRINGGSSLLTAYPSLNTKVLQYIKEVIDLQKSPESTLNSPSSPRT